MFTNRRWVAALLGLPLLATACHEDESPPLGPEADVEQHSFVHLDRIGDPIWQPVDFHLFSAPIGTPETGFQEFVATAVSLLPPPNHQFHPQLIVGPGAPHAPPYDTEFAGGLATLGFEEGHVFGASDFSGGNAVFLVFMVVPAPGVTGSSPDFASGPIIPNSLFPINITGTSTRNGETFDPALANLPVPPLDDPTLTPSFDVEGHSHFPVFIAEATIFGPGDVGPGGDYKYAITMLDQQGNGWALRAHYVVQKKG